MTVRSARPAPQARLTSPTWLDHAIVASSLWLALAIFWVLLEVDAPDGAAAAVVLLLAVVVVAREASAFADVLNPLTVIVGIAVARFGLPAAGLLDPDFVPPVDSSARQFHASREELVAGFELASFGVLAVIAGWYSCPSGLIRAFQKVHTMAGRALARSPALEAGAWVGFGAGLIAAGIYLTANFGDPIGAALSGVARGRSAPGSSAYGFAAVGLLITSALLLVLVRSADPGRSALAALAPAGAATVAMTVFGGRVVALTPIALGCVVIHYTRREHRALSGGVSRRAVRAVAAALAVTVLIGYAAFVPQYRGGSGVSGIGSVLSPGALRDYLEFSLWTEFGALHPYALSERLGPGVLNGATYPEMGGLLGTLAGLEGARPGNVLVERLGPEGSGTTWGFQTGLVPDVFLNSGLFGAILVAFVFGVALRGEYEGFRRTGRTFGTLFLHCLILWTAIWVFFESIVVLPSQLQVALPVAVAIVIASRLLERNGVARSDRSGVR